MNRTSGPPVFFSPRRIPGWLAFFLLALIQGTSHSDDQVLSERTVELSSPKFQAKVLKISFPQGFRSAQRIHAQPGLRYVIKGRVRILDDGETKEYGPGEVFWELQGNFMAENIGAGELDLLVVEMIPEEPPEKPPIPAPKKKKGVR